MEWNSSYCTICHSLYQKNIRGGEDDLVDGNVRSSFFQSNLVLKYGYFSLPMKMFANIFLVAYIIFAPVRPCVTLAFYINLFFSSLLEHF